MDKYKQMYYKLFNKLTDIATEIAQIQSEAEELFLQADEEKTTGQE